MIYNYRCKDCGNHITKVMSVKEYEEFDGIVCSECGSDNVVREYGKPPVTKYNTTGFYSTEDLESRMKL